MCRACMRAFMLVLGFVLMFVQCTCARASMHTDTEYLNRINFSIKDSLTSIPYQHCHINIVAGNLECYYNIFPLIDLKCVHKNDTTHVIHIYSIKYCVPTKKVVKFWLDKYQLITYDDLIRNFFYSHEFWHFQRLTLKNTQLVLCDMVYILHMLYLE